jgi:hypothetical protein
MPKFFKEDVEVTDVIEIVDGRYFAAMWALHWPTLGRDWLAALYRDAEGPWRLVARVRVYFDDKAHDSDDPKHWRSFTGERDVTEAKLVQIIDLTADQMVKVNGHAQIHKLILRTDRARKISEALNREDFMHSRYDAAR